MTIKQILLVATMAVFSLFANAQGRKEWKELKSDVSLFVTNDNGRNGYYEQKPIARLMGEMAEVIGPEAILALGDVHHYGGVQSAADPLWMTNYELIYSHPELMENWYAVCGNHEYRGNTQALLDYAKVSRRWCMPAKYYSRTFEDDGVSVKVVFLDTPPLIDKYRKDTETYPDAAREDMGAQLSWLEKELDGATENWVVVVGHHPIYADTPKNESERTDMQERVGKILRRHKVDMYICGHIHNFQHIRLKDSDIDYVVNSSASLSRPDVNPVEGTVFVSGKPGFSVLGASAHTLTLSMIDAEGNVLHTVTRKK